MAWRYGSWLGLISLWLLVGVTALLTRSLTPVDETRYATVAWEMWSRGDLLVPTLNGEPYSHKPPLFFWLIHAGWWLTGVNEWVVRAVAPLVALLSLFASANLARQLWPDDVTTPRLVPWVVFGSIVFTAFFSWVQIDLLLVLWTVLGMTGIVAAARGVPTGWLLTGIAIGLGVLSKGPVILLHVLPVALLAPLWQRQGEARTWWLWYAGLIASVLLGAAIALAWALPAATVGGEIYREAILWGQTAGRVVTSFAHAHPWWWYLPWLAVLFAPWCLLPRLWISLRSAEFSQDTGLRFCLTWLLAVFILLSLISGKQLKYLLPLLPAFACLVCRVLSRMDAHTVRQRPWFPAAGTGLTGILLMALPYIPNQPVWATGVHPVWGGLLVVGAVIAVLARPVRLVQMPVRLTLFSVFIICVIQIGILRIAAPAYDVRAASRVIAEAQAAGQRVVSVLPYHGEFGFYGRLTEPLISLADIPAQARVDHRDNYLVVRGLDSLAAYPKAVYTQPYRSGYLGIWKGTLSGDLESLVKRRE